MRNTLNCYANSLEAYYNIIKKYCELNNEKQSVYFTDEQFLEYVYEQAINEFKDGVEYHAANEYHTAWATVIISTGEFVEQLVDNMIEDDEEFNGLLSLYYHSKEIEKKAFVCLAEDGEILAEFINKNDAIDYAERNKNKVSEVCIYFDGEPETSIWAK